MRRLAAPPALCLMIASPAGAAPTTCGLEPEESSVGFETDFGPDHITGTCTVNRADLTVDFDRLANTQVAVTPDTRRATASFPFVAQAMKGPKVLDSATWPEITFVSSSVHRAEDAALVDGALTIRGITRPVTLQASLYRQRGTAEGDLSQLTIRLTGAVNRSDYGATGWSDMVGDQVRLDILARIRQAD
jgi:polyisoprenoid-binding protein YceI